MKKPLVVIWDHPGRSKLVSNVPQHVPSPDNPLPVPEGSVLRCGEMLGEVLPDREIDGVPLSSKSVMVRCTFSISRFSELDTSKIAVWSLGVSQRLTGVLMKEALREPAKFLTKFLEVEKKVQARRARERLEKMVMKDREEEASVPRKRPPGKRSRSL